MFKKYDQKQQFLLPINLEDFIAEDHIPSWRVNCSNRTLIKHLNRVCEYL